MKISVIGTGYVGLVAGACLADVGNEVICIDNDLGKVDKLNKGIIPIYEPGLEEIIKSNVREKRLIFSYDLDFAVKHTEVCFIAVGTPQGKDGAANLDSVFNVAELVAKAMNGYKVIINKSTVPVGTAYKIVDIIKSHTDYQFDVVSNPEFLKQGNAVNDFLHPDRIIIGSDSKEAVKIMQEVYAPFFRTGNRVIVMDVRSAEMTKYAANSFLATKISFMNEIANLCEKVGADIEMIRVGMSTDSRIGNKFLFPGIGYGGSCFPKDVKALIKIGSLNNCSMKIIEAVDEINRKQKSIFIDKIISRFGRDLTNKTFAVWGLAFKPNTNDIREAPAVYIIKYLLNLGAKIQVFDPKAIESAQDIFGNAVKYFNNAYDALKQADCLLLLTEWNEFRYPDFEKIKLLLKNPIIFDGRNQYEANKLKEKGFKYVCMGRI